MKKIKKLIAQIFSKKNIKVWSLFFIFGLIFFSKAYATGSTNTDGSIVNNISYYLHLLLSLASWVWIILANLAGKLMTNDILYGSFLHLDASLWTLWNIMKNFANFILGFFVLYAIVQNLISGPLGKDTGEWNPVKIIKKTLIAGVLIQSSWFLMGAMVDVSTIMTSAIGSFPSQFIASNNNFRGHMHSNLKSLTKTEITFDPTDQQNIVKTDENSNNENLDDDDIKKILDTITPNYNSLAGPLLFIGFAVFDFNNFENFSVAGQSSVNSIDERGDLFLSLGLSAMIIVFFSLMMFFIFMFNLFRILILWILIPLLPIIILFKIFKITEKLGGGNKGMDLSKFMDIKTIVMLVFKPVFMVLSLSVILVILVLIKGIISPPGNKIGQVLLEDHGNFVIETVGYASGNNSNLYTSTIKSDGIMEFSVSGVKQTFADIIVYLFGLFLMYFLVRMVVSINTGIGFIDNAMTNTFKTFEKVLINLPIIPVAGGIGISAAKEADISQAATRLAGIDIGGQQSRINQLLGLGTTFSSLSTSMSKDDWLSNAVAAGKTKGHTTVGALLGDPDFTPKLTERNRVNTTTENSITNGEISAAFNGTAVNDEENT